jgi:hypothetical protein
MPRILNKVSFEDVVNSPQNTIYYGAVTCWWTHDPTHLLLLPSGLPADPRGGVLLQADKLAFLQRARDAADHYGKHGLLALLAAHHSNCVDDNNRPTCFDNWKAYNRMIDNEQKRRHTTT